jgi:hypothetical protein
MTDKTDDLVRAEAGLDDLFADLRATPEPIAPDFLARLTTEALQAQPVVVHERSRKAPLAELLSDLFGGWKTLGGLGLAAMAGVWIGAFPPALIDQGLYGTETIDLFPETLSLLEEG